MSKSASLPLEVASAGLRGLAISDGHSTDTSSASERLCGVYSEGTSRLKKCNVVIRIFCLDLCVTFHYLLQMTYLQAVTAYHQVSDARANRPNPQALQHPLIAAGIKVQGPGMLGKLV